MFEVPSGYEIYWGFTVETLKKLWLATDCVFLQVSMRLVIVSNDRRIENARWFLSSKKNTPRIFNAIHHILHHQKKYVGFFEKSTCAAVRFPLYLTHQIMTVLSFAKCRILANTKHLYNIGTTSAQRLRRWVDVVQMLCKYFVFAGIVSVLDLTKNDTQGNAIKRIQGYRLLSRPRNCSGVSYCYFFRGIVWRSRMTTPTTWMFVFARLPH